MEEKNILEAIVTKDKMFFPKGSRYNDEGEFAIITFSVEEVIQGKPKKHPIYRTITVKGNMPRIVAGKKYHLVANEVYDETYKNYNYEVNYIGDRVYSIDNKEDIKTVLQEVTSENNVNKIMELENIVEILKNKDASALQQVKGIGESLSAKIIEKFSDKSKFGMSRVILSRMGLSERMIEHLRERYSNYDLALEKIKSNPYMLADEVKGIGFLRADALAKQFNIAQNSSFRIAAFVSYYLNKSADEGKSFVPTREVLENLRSNTDKEYPIAREVITETFNNMKYKNELWWNDNKSILALTEIRNMEQEIAKHLIRLSSAKIEDDLSTWEKTVKSIEKKKGFKYTDEQYEGIKTVLNNPLTVVTGLAGCVDAETEFFNGFEWKKISEYNTTDKVLQYTAEGKGELVNPIRYIKEDCEEFFNVTNNSGTINMFLSEDHDVVYRTGNKYLRTIKMRDLYLQHNSSKNGFGGSIPTTFRYECGKGIPLTDNEIKLMLAVMADGHFSSRSKTTRCKIELRKKRKIEELERLLNAMELDFTKSEYNRKGSFIYRFNAPLKLKVFPKDWYNATRSQLELIADNVLKWDGSVSGKKRFATVEKDSADFVQFVFTSLGYRTNILTEKRERQGWKTCYIVTIAKRSKDVTIRGAVEQGVKKPEIKKVKSQDGYKYCFSVPSGMLILRRNNKIFITGNCGKTSTLEPMTQILVEQQGKKIIQVALAGKASQRIQEVTGYEAMTIHRALEFQGGRFGKDSENPIDADIVVIDEGSMIDGRLFLSLLQAIPTGTRVVILGDEGQLSSIGVSNVFFDLLNCDTIPVVKLSKIHRQAEKSAVITTSRKVRDRQQIVSLGEEKTETLGELQDLILDVKTDKSRLLNNVIEHFNNRLLIEKDIMEVQVVAATKTRGELSTFNLNNKIKEIVNPINSQEYFESTLDGKHRYQISKGDKVIISKNNYKVDIWDSEKETFTTGSIFNGNLGIVEKIGIGYVVLNIANVGYVRIEEKHYNTVELGYCITCHRGQGSGWNSVIVAIDSGSYIMLSCELLYTAITRAKNHCVLVGETKAIRRCCSVANGNNKQTFLPSFLEKLR